MDVVINNHKNPKRRSQSSELLQTKRQPKLSLSKWIKKFKVITNMAATTVQQQNVTDFLSKKQKESSKDLVTEWATLEELHNKK